MANQHINPNDDASTSTPSSPQALRQRAEASLRAAPRADIGHTEPLLAQETSRLIHDLLVHQIELEMQNEELRRAEAELAVMQAHYIDLFDQAPVGYVTLNAQGLLLQANLTAASLLGVALQALQMCPIFSFILKSDQDIFYLHRAQLLASREPQGFKLRLLKADASSFWAHLTMTRAQVSDGIPVLRLTISDITERRLTDDRLRLIEAALAVVSQGVLITDTDGRILSGNQAFSAITGYRMDDILGRDCKFLHGPLSAQTCIGSSNLASQQETEFAGEILNYRKDGSTFWNELTISPVRNRRGVVTHFVTVMRDITARHVLEDKVRRMALYDELTQLPNRRLINDRLTQTLAISRRSGCFCALMVLDLDNFKALNDQRGHLVGDLLLVEVARRLTSCVREIDTVGRFGGDEFVVTLGELNASKTISTAQAAIIAEKIRKSLAEPYLLQVTHDGGSDSLVVHHGSASIGVKVFADTGTSRHAILTRADAAMYQAKKEGRNRVQFYVPA